MRRLLLLVVVAVAGVLAWAAIQPAGFRITRQIRIAAPAAAIFPLVNDFDAWAGWSPWERKDPAMERARSGAAAGPGSVYTWRGNADVGEGRMEIVGATPPSQVRVALDFTAPMAARNEVLFTLEPDGAGQGTTVTWTMSGTNGYIAKLAGLFLDVDAMVGKDFDAGLAALKALAEAPAAMPAAEMPEPASAPAAASGAASASAPDAPAAVQAPAGAPAKPTPTGQPAP